jgi:hypothetical protein
MRPCAVCKALLTKLMLCDSVRCGCGWEWQRHSELSRGSDVSVIFRGRAMAKIIEFYVPTTFRKSGKWIPAGEPGKVIEFVPLTKKTA